MPTDATHPDSTPEENARILAKFKAEFTASELLTYLVDDDEKFPAEQVLAELEEMVRVADAQREGGDGGR